MTEQEIVEKVIKHDEQLKVLARRVDKIDVLAESCNKMAISNEKLAMSIDSMKKTQEQLINDVQEMKMAPARDAKEIKNKLIIAALSAIVTAIIAAVLALIFK